MGDVVIAGAVRTPFGKRKGALSTLHSVELLADVMSVALERAGVAPDEVGQVIGGCTSQVGMQSFNVARGAWLTAGLPATTAATTIDAQCGSAQQAVNLAYGLIASGAVDVAMACGVELMSRLPLGATVPKDGAYGKPVTKRYWQHHEYTTQFEAAERIADAWGITRDDCDAFGVTSQERARQAQAGGRFATQLVPVAVPAGEDGAEARVVDADEGVRDTSLEALARLKPTGRPEGVHTAGTSSQISDGASAVVLMSAERAAATGVRPLATVVDTCLVGTDPVLMLTGPIDATRRLFERTGLGVDDIDLFEVNEAFASVVLAWERELKPDMAKVNPNGGAIALGHPVGATGAALVAKAVHELERLDKELALVTMCCGGGLGTGTLLRRG